MTKSKTPKIYLDEIPPKAFYPKRRCLYSQFHDETTTERIRKTPRAKASQCVGSIRLGQDGKTLYISVLKLVKNPHYKRSTGTGFGMHWTAHWRKVYDRVKGKTVRVHHR
jgi:hypothetical protein